MIPICFNQWPYKNCVINLVYLVQKILREINFSIAKASKIANDFTLNLTKKLLICDKNRQNWQHCKQK